MGNEDLERAHEMSEWDALVGLPLLSRRKIIDEDDEILFLSLVMGLDNLSFSASHVDDLFGWLVLSLVCRVVVCSWMWNEGSFRLSWYL